MIGPFDPFRLRIYSRSRQRFFFLPIVLLPCCLYWYDFIGFVAFFASEEASSACIQPKTDLAVTIVTNPELSGCQIPFTKTNTVIKVKVPLFAVCQHWLKLHVLHSHHDGSP